ncbi:hypothetical protein [Virgibacillus sp. SK37]|uniref:hypothetical protein n=1 Tax=Virgibacillus sp. SK37 TaxID=403957 RepID=UPI0004D0B89B|nr:hypothetical protein [Virgibacillus sp. SK37]AIF45656.1 hypothetical protein X953_18885 [Virgibacillus sp. SK37]
MITNEQIGELIIGSRDLIRTGILSCNIYKMQDYEDFEALVFLRLTEKIKENENTYYKLLENKRGYFVRTVQNIIKNEFRFQSRKKRNRKNEVLMDEEKMWSVC